MGVLKLGMLDVVSVPFSSQREAWNWEFHLIIWHCVKDVVYGKNVTVPFLPASVWVIKVFAPLPGG